MSEIKSVQDKLVALIRRTAVETHCEIGSDNLSTWKCSLQEAASKIRTFTLQTCLDALPKYKAVGAIDESSGGCLKYGYNQALADCRAALTKCLKGS